MRQDFSRRPACFRHWRRRHLRCLAAPRGKGWRCVTWRRHRVRQGVGGAAARAVMRLLVELSCPLSRLGATPCCAFGRPAIIAAPSCCCSCVLDGHTSIESEPAGAMRGVPCDGMPCLCRVGTQNLQGANFCFLLRRAFGERATGRRTES